MDRDESDDEDRKGTNRGFIPDGDNEKKMKQAENLFKNSNRFQSTGGKFTPQRGFGPEDE